MGTGTELGRVRGLGSARQGAHHWISHRLSALSNILLTVWLLTALLRLPNFEHDTMLAWLGSPWAAVPMLLLLASVLTHMRLGLTVFIEDYAHEAAGKLTLLVLLNFYAIAAFALGLYAIARILFTGVAA